ncbi:30S ribosomal protein S13 [Candidatus Woesearchaeota archaeon]|nr:30S ribosomal protein S13 [Candidatus Woesearchaeota archaeon]|tara:strand:- start:3125 stop:3628 length:504 start_codon:yes stop_codon:yes gene_type:complete
MVETPQQNKEKDDFRYFIRIANTDLDGNKQIAPALTKIKGVGFMFSNMVCNLAGIDKTSKTGYLKDEQVKKLDDVLNNPSKYDIPSWMLNTRKRYDDGKDYHILTSDLTFKIENDIKKLKKIRSYRGIRHGIGLPLRGQRTKSNFRKNKGKSSLGVKRKEGAKSGRT